MKIIRRARAERKVPRLEVAVAEAREVLVRRRWDARALREEIDQEFRGFGCVVREEDR